MTKESFILYLHRVGEKHPNQISANKNMIITPEELESFINIQKKSYDFISLDELNENLNKKILPKKILHLTFDDGYLDNYTHALPILNYYNIPFTIYLTTSFINSNYIPWWYQLENIINNEKEIVFDGNNYLASNIYEKNQTFLKIRNILFSSKEKMKYLESFIKKFEKNHISKPLFLSWEQVKNLSCEKITTIGAHTVTHPNLVNLSNSESEHEILNSKQQIEYKIEKKVNHFAFPYGGSKNYSSKHIDILIKNNFTSAVTTNFGFLNQNCFKNRHEIPRIMLGSDFFTLRRRIHRIYKSNFK